MVPLRNFDLNLLKALDALLAERNVTRAASRLFVTQQAVSGMLQRLRAHFDDELLIRVGRHFELTPLASSLVVPVRETLLAARAALNVRPMFDPGTASGTYRIAMTDYALSVLMSRFLQILASSAPGIKCIVEPLAKNSFERVEMGDLDFCIAANHNDWRIYGDYRPSSHIRSQCLFGDDFVCVFDGGHAPAGPTMTIEDYTRARHNSVAFGHGIVTIVENAWNTSGFDFDVRIAAPSFSALILMLPGTPFVATVMRRLANLLAPPLGLSIVECPLAVPALQENLTWHERNDHDPKHVYIRSLLGAAAATLDASEAVNHKLSL